MMNKQEEWKDKVRFIAGSVDEKKDKVADHIKDKKWTGAEFYMDHEGDAKSDFGAYEPPKCFLVDKKGKICFVGEPSYRQYICQDIDRLLKGEEIKGTGTEKRKTLRTK